MAALLIIVERIGKAIRNPPRDVMLSHAAKEMGYGRGFGIHEALDQFGALFGPLLVAVVFSSRGDYRAAFAILVFPALVVLCLLLGARLLYPRPEDLEPATPNLQTEGLPRVFWVYLIGAALVAAGFADFSLIAYHGHRLTGFSRPSTGSPGSLAARSLGFFMIDPFRRSSCSALPLSSWPFRFSIKFTYSSWKPLSRWQNLISIVPPGRDPILKPNYRR